MTAPPDDRDEGPGWTEVTPELIQVMVGRAMVSFDEQFMAALNAEPDPEWRATMARHLPKARDKAQAIVESRAAEVEAQLMRLKGELQ